MRLQRHFIRTGRGYRLALWEAVRPARADQPLVVLCHGLGTTHRNHLITAISEDLAAHGYPVLVFDFAGYGETGGRVADRLVRNFIADLKDVIAWSRKYGRMTIGGTVIIGHSIGALTALLAAPDLAVRDIRGIVLIGCNARSAAKYHQLVKQGRIRKLARYMIVGSSKVASNFWTDRRRLEPEKFARRTNVPALLMTGVRDVTNPPAESRMLMSWLRGPKKLEVIRGTDHYFRESGALRSATRTIRIWLAGLGK